MPARKGKTRIAKLAMPAGDPFKHLVARCKEFQAQSESIATRSTSVATQATRAAFRRRVLKRPSVASRPGRLSTQGQFTTHLRWARESGPGSTSVGFDVQRIDKVAGSYWRVQEVGTGKNAFINPGRQQKNARRTNKSNPKALQIPSQVGRFIPRGYQFHTRGGKYSAPGASRNEQIAPLRVGSFPSRSGAQGPASPASVAVIGPIQIKREIEGKHFVRDGAQAGFAVYEQQLLAAARAAFPKRS